MLRSKAVLQFIGPIDIHYDEDSNMPAGFYDFSVLGWLYSYVSKSCE